MTREEKVKMLVSLIEQLPEKDKQDVVGLIKNLVTEKKEGPAA